MSYGLCCYCNREVSLSYGCLFGDNPCFSFCCSSRRDTHLLDRLVNLGGLFLSLPIDSFLGCFKKPTNQFCIGRRSRTQGMITNRVAHTAIVIPPLGASLQPYTVENVHVISLVLIHALRGGVSKQGEEQNGRS